MAWCQNDIEKCWDHTFFLKGSLNHSFSSILQQWFVNLYYFFVIISYNISCRSTGETYKVKNSIISRLFQQPGRISVSEAGFSSTSIRRWGKYANFNPAPKNKNPNAYHFIKPSNSPTRHSFSGDFACRTRFLLLLQKRNLNIFKN